MEEKKCTKGRIKFKGEVENTPKRKENGPKVINQSIKKFLTKDNKVKSTDNPVGNDTYMGENTYVWKQWFLSSGWEL